MRVLEETSGTELRTPNKQSIDHIINDERYELKEKIGQGAWGTVYQGYDTKTDQTVAIKFWSPSDTAKKQMEERPTVTKEEFMKTEAIDPNTYRNIAQRVLQFDKNGEPFIVTKLYKKFLTDVMEEHGQRKSYLNGHISLEKAVKLTLDIAEALGDMHTKRKDPLTGEIKPKVHGDIKPDNVGIDKTGGIETAEPIDFGSATTTEYGLQKGQKPNIGHLYSRAPEVFYYENIEINKISLEKLKDIRPTEQSDVFSAGEIFYELLIGDPLFKEEYSQEDPAKFIHRHRFGELNHIIKKKIETKKLPKKAKYILKKSLNQYPSERYKNCAEMAEDIRKYHEKITDPNRGWKDFKKWFKRITLPAIGASFIFYAGAVHEPTDKSLPNITKGQLVLDEAIPANSIVFEKEEETKYVPSTKMRRASQFNTISKNPYVVHLIGAFSDAVKKTMTNLDMPTKRQFDIYLANTLPASTPGYDKFARFLSPIARTIELSMNNNYRENGTIDLEDMCVESIVGPKKMNKAKIQALKNMPDNQKLRGEDYSVYKNATYDNGNPIFSQEEKEFIDTWLGNVQLTSYQFPQNLKSGSEQDSSQSVSDEVALLSEK